MPTTNHGYNTPSEGTENWDDPINENFEKIDTDMEIRDTEDNLEDYEPKQGAKFRSVDTAKVFLGDGDEWIYQTQDSGTDEGGNLRLTGRSTVYAYGVDGNYLEPYPVEEYGDLGTAAYAAHDDIDAGVGYGTVILPPTSEDFSQTIDFDEDYISLQGSGMFTTRPRYTGSGPAFRLNGADRGNHGNFGLRGDGSSGQDLIMLTTETEGISHIALQNIYLENAGRHSIHEKLVNWDIYDAMYNTIYINGSGDHAVYSPGVSGTGAASRTLFNFQAMTSTIHGDFIHDMSGGIHKRYISIEGEPSVNGTNFRVQNGYCPIFFGCRGEGQDGHSFHLTNTRSALLQNCISWASGGDGIFLESDNREFNISQYYCTGAAGDDLRILNRGDQNGQLGMHNASANIESGVDIHMDVQNRQFGNLDGR